MNDRNPRRWRHGIRPLLVGVAAAVIALMVMTALGLTGYSVILAAAIAALLIESAIHRRGLRWVLRRGRGDKSTPHE